MKHLLDVSALLPLIWQTHPFAARVAAWRKGKTLVLCPLAELGFLRISTGPACNATMADARTALAKFKADEGAEWIPDDLPALDGMPPASSKQVADFYFGNLAQKHGMAWATFDENSGHPAAATIP